MIKWIINKWYKNNPICECGYRMKPFEKWTNRYQWECIKCSWETFEDDYGRLHWFKKD